MFEYIFPCDAAELAGWIQDALPGTNPSDFGAKKIFYILSPTPLPGIAHPSRSKEEVRAEFEAQYASYEAGVEGGCGL